MSKTPILGTGTDFSLTNTTGYIAEFITNVADPSLLSIPTGAWNFSLYFSSSNNSGNPSFYIELYKYDGATFTLIGSNSTSPEIISNGTAIDLYTTSVAVPLTTLTVNDRLAVRVFVNTSGSRTITLHTEDNHLCEIITTFSTGINTLNGLSTQVQYFATGTSGTDFAISSVIDTHTFNLPTASASNRGALSSTDWSTFNSKIDGSGNTNYVPRFTGTSTIGNSTIKDDGTTVGIQSNPNATQTVRIVGSSVAIDTALYVVNSSLNATTTYGINVSSSTTKTDANIGIYASASNSTTANTGVVGVSSGSGGLSLNIGGSFNASGGATNYSLKLQDGTETVGRFLKCITADGKANWASVSLTYFTEAQSTTAPNATVYANSLTVVSAVANTDFAIVPKGTGGLLLAVPDNTATGGNKRGNNAIDLQMVRGANTQVASGTNAILIGNNCTSSGSSAVTIGRSTSNASIDSVAIGSLNTVSGGANQGSVAIGYNNTTSGNGGVTLGSSNTASFANSTAIGYNNTATTAQNTSIGYACNATGSAPCVAMGYSATSSGQTSVSIGRSTIASGSYSLATGYGSNTYSIIGRWAHSPTLTTTTGENQKSTFVLWSRTSGNTPTALSADNGVAGASNQINLQNNNSIRFKGSIVARQTGSTNTSAWDIDGLIQRGANAASTTLLVSNVILVQNTPAWGTPTLAANTTLGGLTINVTGVAATNIMWVATIDTTEVIYA